MRVSGEKNIQPDQAPHIYADRLEHVDDIVTAVLREERLKGDHFEYRKDYQPSPLVGGSFGLFGGPRAQVRLLFEAKVGRFVLRRLWHPTQKTRKTERGVELTMEVAGTTELKTWILGWGNHVEVLEPESRFAAHNAVTPCLRARWLVCCKRCSTRKLPQLARISAPTRRRVIARIEHAMPESSKVEELQKQLGVDWPNLTAARTLTAARRQAVELAVEGFASADVSVVMAGSFARDELTSGSDPDWSLLVDGAADPHHFETAQAVGKKIRPLFVKDEGRERTFGTPSFSHELVHQIGGQDDTNRNTTRRILLLLESTPVGRTDAYDRVVNCVLNRYVLEDRTFAQKKTKHHVPRFLLNDIARYWRTMAVDFAYKARTRGGEGFAIRNFKLRMSRKLIYVSGMLSCFACELGMTQNGTRSDCTRAEQECVRCLRDFMCRPPLEVLSDVLLQLGPDAQKQATKVMGAYDKFLGILADDKKREALEKLDPAKGEDEDLFDRRNVTHDFRDGLLELFFDVPRIAALTRIYGVF